MAELERKIECILEQYVDRGIVGVSLALGLPGQNRLLLAKGYADRFEKVPMTPDHIFRIASCTKMFVATGLHLLVEGGLVDLDEPISRWFPNLPRAAQRPVRILLNHRSGLPDFEASMPMISDKYWAAEEIVAFAYENGVEKKPWHGMEYSNTGYVLAGMIIEKETGKSYAHHLRERIFEPLGMTSTWVGSHESFPVERMARAYMHADDDNNPQWDVSGAGEPKEGVWDATDWFPLSGANAAGDMLSTPDDIVTFLEALFDGRILGSSQLREMKDNLDTATFPGSAVTHHGHGVLCMTYGDILVKGHLGQLPGHTSLAGTDEQTGAAAMLIQNSGAGDFESFYLKGVHEPFGAIFEEIRKSRGK